MDLYYYNLQTKLDMMWYHPKIISYKKYNEINKSFNDIRFIACPAILNGGWHLSYFGDAKIIANKVQNFSHQEFNENKFTDLVNIEEKMKKSKDLFDRNISVQKIEIKNNLYLPVDYEKYLRKFIQFNISILYI